MKGLELAEKYFYNNGLPMIQNAFSQHSERIAGGLVGDGSECFGFDDAISRDHDWGPSFCLWLTMEDYNAIGGILQKEYDNLPKSIEGYESRKTSDWGQGRVGVFEIGQFYANFIGIDNIPSNLDDWISLPEQSLAACTNGKVFYDPLGEFSRFRSKLLEFYPDDVRLKKMASRCMTIAQSGQYNLERSIKRNEYFAAQYAETKFCADVMSLIFLINKRYTPFYKWVHRALKQLPILGAVIHMKIAELISTKDYNEKPRIVEEICSAIIEQLKNEELTDSSSNYLLDHGPIIQSKIRDPQMRERNVWVG
ncbi:MAG: DUF4037 domain-containing protein [Spirochaetota bacterium]|nr:DUF4037 domain-containing protein [Spirochaetota bacterium]